METILLKIAENGGTGLLAVVLLYQIVFFGKKVLSTIDNNTEALASFKEVIRNCTEKDKNNG